MPGTPGCAQGPTVAPPRVGPGGGPLPDHPHERPTVPDDLLRSRRWALRADPRSAVRTAVVWEVLDGLLAQRRSATGADTLEVVDLGGGTGGFAVPVAMLGHRVTVVEPSPDALAALQRRAAEA